MNLVREIRVTIKRVTEVTVQVQAGAPVDLLLGTDFLGDGSAEELLQGGRWGCESQNEVEPQSAAETVPALTTAPPNSTSSPVTVSLLQATCLPPQYAKTIRAKVTTKSQSPSLFEPETESLPANQLKMPNAIVEPDRGQQITLVIQNHGLLPLKLKKDHVLGHMLPADPIGVLEADHYEESTDRVAHLVASVGQSDGNSDHAECCN